MTNRLVLFVHWSVRQKLNRVSSVQSRPQYIFVQLHSTEQNR